MSFGAPTVQPRQTTTTRFSPQQKQLWQWARPGLRKWSEETPERYPGTQIAGFDPSQWKGQQMALQTALGAQRDITQDASRANQFLMGDIWNPKSNPYLERAIGAATRPITENYRENVLPGIRDQALAAGQQFGGSRRGVAEGVASRGYLNAIGDTSSKLVQDQYANNLRAMTQATAFAPQTAQAALMPSMTTSGVGDLRQRMAQAKLGEQVSNFNYDENARYYQAKDLLNILSGLPGGTAISTANNPPAPPWWMQSMGGAGMGASAGASLGPWGSLFGGGIGALLPFLTQ